MRIATLLVLLVAAILMVWVWRRPQGLPARASLGDEARTLSPDLAYDRAVALHLAGDLRAALPLYRRALEGHAGASWSLHYSYAAALHSCITAHRTTRGVEVPLTRASDEAARLAHEALAEYQRAAALASDPHDRATVLARAGDLYRVWGLPWEAFSAYREASALDPGNEAIATRGDALMLLLEHPERHTSGTELPE